MSQLEKVLLYIRTIKYLKPVQVFYQLKRKCLKNGNYRLMKQLNIDKLPKEYRIPQVFIKELDLDQDYIKRFWVEDFFDGKVTLLHETHKLDLKKWEVSSASHLWNYNLQYLEFLIPICVKYRETKEDKYLEKWYEIMDAWLENKAADCMEPYTISMRIPNLLICMNLLEESLEKKFQAKLVRSIYVQYQYLLKNQELALLGNHYFENLKAILLSAWMFFDSRQLHKYYPVFLNQVREQILSDGVHYERSLMYHKLILEDLLRLRVALKDSEKISDALDPVIGKMVNAMTSLERGFDRTPLMNDAGDNVSKRKEALYLASEAFIKKEKYQDEFPDAGYYKLENGKYSILFDCGSIGPSYMSGHSHCDTLSFELFADEKPFFVNSGTGLYQGEAREFFRSTKAHNTMMIDEREQSELWGEHRAARRISGWCAQRKENLVKGEFYSYSGDFFRRKMTWRGNVLQITDCAKSKDGSHRLRIFFHLAPGFIYEEKENIVEIFDKERNEATKKEEKYNLKEKKAEITFETEGTPYNLKVHRKGNICQYAEEFGKFQQKEVLEVQVEFDEEIHITTSIHFIKNNTYTEEIKND